MTEPDPVTKVARDLSEILALADALEDQAVAKATDREIPGGAAMVALGPVADADEWAEQIAAAELRHFSTCPRESHTDCVIVGAEHVADQDDSDDPLWTLWYWTEQWRREWSKPIDRPTLATEALFVREVLTWAWQYEPGFPDLAHDVADVRRALEDEMHAGKRTTRGVRCFDCDVDLVRKSEDRREPRYCHGDGDRCHWPHRNCPHDRGGLRDEWVCPSCQRSYDEETYRRAVSSEHFLQSEWLPLAECVERTGVPRGSIQTWATTERGHVRKRKDQTTGRTTYNVADIEARVTKTDVAS